MTKLILPQWVDYHMHARQGGGFTPFLLREHLKMGCCGILAMPNTKPPIAKVSGEGPGTSIVEYRNFLMESGGDKFEHVFTPLWLSNYTTPKMIEDGAKAGILTSAKYYPPHATTGSHAHGVLEPMPFEHYLNNGVFEAMQACGIKLNIHGEGYNLTDEQWFNRDGNSETIFNVGFDDFAYRFSGLFMVREHISDRRTVHQVENGPDNVAATICPQHLLYTIGTQARKNAAHLRCEPVVKYPEDRDELRRVITSRSNKRFFAGTDSAAHFRGMKETACGCASGCFTGGIAPQLYAMAFEAAGCSLDIPDNAAAFANFLVHNGNRFYGVKTSEKTFTLARTESQVEELQTPDSPVVPLTLGLGESTLPWSVAV